jgi:4'-phosphopantetheinyl transferase
MPLVHCHDLNGITWEEAAESALTLPEGVDIWRIPLDFGPDHADLLQSFLTTEERNKVFRYVHREDQLRALISRGMLRYLAGKYLDQPPALFQLELGNNKKPYLRHTGPASLHFNISHSGNWVLLAFARLELGVDVEEIQENFNYTEILPLSFSQQEASEIQQHPDPRPFFYRLWTRKESLTKATAKGLDNAIPSIPSLNGTHTVPAAVIGSGLDWTVSSFGMRDAYQCSLAHPSSLTGLRFRHLAVL